MTMNTAILMLMLLPAVFGADVMSPVPSTIRSMRYPALGLQAQIRGTVRLRLTIDTTGAVASAEVISGNAVLASASQENAKQWRFSRGGVAVETHFEIVYEFKLQGRTDSCPQTDFTFVAPNRIEVVAPIPHWMQ